jgi:hypothetical protein
MPPPGRNSAIGAVATSFASFTCCAAAAVRRSADVRMDASNRVIASSSGRWFAGSAAAPQDRIVLIEPDAANVGEFGGELFVLDHAMCTVGRR